MITFKSRLKIKILSFLCFFLTILQKLLENALNNLYFSSNCFLLYIQKTAADELNLCYPPLPPITTYTGTSFKQSKKSSFCFSGLDILPSAVTWPDLVLFSGQRAGTAFRHFFLTKFFKWSIEDVQCCASLCCAAEWLSYTHICILL